MLIRQDVVVYVVHQSLMVTSELAGEGCRDGSGNDGGMFPTVSIDDRPGDADSDISFEFLGFSSFLAFAGEAKMASGLEAR
jgi:hypothetical protein